jgi:hypothetical protein
MSSKEDEATDTVMCCASCGIAAVDNVKMKNCDGGCDLVKYCSDKCQDNHREQHEGECRKRAVELRDNDLFTMTEGSCFGECPICCLPLPIDRNKSGFMTCCSKYICRGCNFANQVREIDAGLRRRCVFCREPLPESKEESFKRAMKRIKENNDPAAICHVGQRKEDEGDYETALEYLTKAAGLGDAEAHSTLSLMYLYGEGVEKDIEKGVHHMEEAAIGGHPTARYNLGIGEWNNGRFERAKKHFIIAANLGHEKSLQALRQLYADGHASKEDYAGALRAYQAAVDATKSEEREKAEKAMKSGEVISPEVRV